MNFDEIIMKIDPKEYYTLTQVSTLSGFSYTAILNRVKTGQLPYRLILNRRFVSGKDLIKALTSDAEVVK